MYVITLPKHSRALIIKSRIAPFCYISMSKSGHIEERTNSFHPETDRFILKQQTDSRHYSLLSNSLIFTPAAEQSRYSLMHIHYATSQLDGSKHNCCKNTICGFITSLCRSMPQLRSYDGGREGRFTITCMKQTPPDNSSAIRDKKA